MSAIPKVILLIDSSRAAGSGFLKGIARYSCLHRPWIAFRNPPFYTESAQNHDSLSRLTELNADGIIMLEPKYADKIIALGLPTITSLLVQEQLSDSSIPLLLSNSDAIGGMAAEYFLNRGFSKFAYCGFEGMFWSDKRGEAFRKKLSEAGLTVHFYSKQDKPHNSWEQEQLSLANWLKSLPKPIGVMACNDDRGQEIIESCRMAQIGIPDEVAVLGVDNDELVCELCNPPLSSIALNFERAGYEAAELLDNLMRGHETMRRQVIPVQEMYVTTRQSTDILAIEDDDVARAVQYIRLHSKDILQVGDVVNALSISRRSLELGFKHVLGRSIHDEIRRVRIELAAKMLLESDQSISQIASELGYASVAHIARYFRQEIGMSPQEYRRHHGRR